MTAASRVAEGRAAFEIHCAACHGPSGQGGYFAHAMRPPSIAGKDAAKIVAQVRGGGKEMPHFSAAVLPDASLDAITTYVHETLAAPQRAPSQIGPRELDPFLVGVVAWGALLLLVCGLVIVFAEGRR